MIASTYATLQDNSTHGEDSFLVLDLKNGGFLDVVLDGVTGHGGEEASRSVAEALKAATINSLEDVIAVLEDMNEEFFQVGGGRFLLTTVSVALYQGDRIYAINAGDSPIYHIRADSHQQLAGRVGGLLRPGGTKVIGGEQILSLNRSEIEVKPGDRLVLATDGVSDNLHVEELVQLVRRAGSPEDASKQIKKVVDLHLEQGLAPEILGARYRHDDQTAIVRFFAPISIGPTLF
jgi:serine/threonine protein phosphatase PrpC